MATIKATGMKTQLETASCNVPLMPCPLVQPPAKRAPKTISAAPRYAAMNRLPVLSPNRQRHKEETAVLVPSPDNRELSSAPRKTPTRSIKYQPILGDIPCADRTA